MELKEALEVFRYHKAMLTCDMSVSRDPEHQDVDPSYWGKEAEDLYNAIVVVEKYIQNAIPMDFIQNWADKLYYGVSDLVCEKLINDWEKGNGLRESN